MLKFSPISGWRKHVRLWVMKLQWKEPICHSVWERCKRNQLRTKDILEAKTSLLSQHIGTTWNQDFQDKKLKLPETPEQLSAKEAAQLIWHSFRFSNGNAALQFTMLHQAWKKYWEQELSVEEVFEELKKLLKIWKKHTKTTEYENKDWIPPHPKVHRFTTETHTDIWLSLTESHRTITSDYIQESDAVIKMLITWKWWLERFWRDSWYSISRSKEYETKWRIVQAILEADFWYLCKSNYHWEFKGRPWRNPEHDGKNNLKDRFFSYLIWFVIRNNKTWNEFFDEYFWEIQEFFPKWFSWLPSDVELEIWNRNEAKKKKDSILWYHHSMHSMRRDPHWYFTQITKEDVLTLIAQYNLTHPHTQVNMSELWLSEVPIFKSPLL